MENGLLALKAPAQVTQTGQPLFSPCDIDNIPRLARLQVNRFEAEIWAISECKFLIYDDTGADKDRAKHSPVQTAESQGSHTCDICTQCPEFPHQEKARKFRLFRPRDVCPDLANTQSTKAAQICSHYVAVSYCWPTSGGNNSSNHLEPRRSYCVRDIDGSLRANRAPDDILDRAVDVANSFGLRMIWIDQECLPQPTSSSSREEKDELQLGLQAMDIIYNRAILTAGLHEMEYSDQPDVDLLHVLTSSASSEAVERELCRGKGFPRALDLVESIRRDRWYTRAWIVQEALSAGGHLVLVFKRAPPISFPSKFRYPEEAFKPPKHSLDTTPRGLPSEVICIPVGSFRRLITRLQHFFQKVSSDTTWGALILVGLKGRKVREILTSVEAQHPAPKPTKSMFSKIQIYGVNNYRKRYIVDAAGALSLLKTRSCRHERDLVAIVANMCGYDIRLDTNDVAAQGKSIYLALLTLALVNGDYSLLVPELYSSMSISRKQVDRKTPHWLYPFDTAAACSIDYLELQSSDSPRLILPHYMWDETLFPAYIWVVENELDMMPVKVRWNKTWSNLKRLRLTVDRLDAETEMAFTARKQQLSNHFSRPKIIHQVKDELMHGNEIAHDSTIWDNIEHAGVQVGAYLDAERVLSNKEKQRQISNIFFDVLRFLFLQSHKDPRAIGVANSIWQSIRVDTIREQDPEDTNNRNQELPDHVCQALFDHEDVAKDAFKTLQLDISRDGQYEQAWLIDRIMSRGSLWVGRYKHGPAKGPFLEHDLQVGRDQLKDVGGGRPGSSKFQMRDRPILQRQLQRRITAMLTKRGTLGYFESRGQSGGPFGTPGGGMGMREVLSEDLWTSEAEDYRARNLVSVFDVDSPCLVATPYNSAWEVLPHPKSRSLSVCWRIEQTRQSGRVAFAPLSQIEKAREEWCKTDPASHKFTSELMEKRRQYDPLMIVPGPPQVLTDSDRHRVELPDTPEMLETLAKGDGPFRRYRVVCKVKGMWEIMDMPYQVYNFC
jgi:hypothetical protein